MLQYLALFDPAEEGGYVVTFPDLKWGVTQGDSDAEAMEMAADALAMILSDYIEKGEPLPTPGRHRGRHYRAVKLPAMQAAKAELYRQFASSGIRKAELARRLNMPKANID